MKAALALAFLLAGPPAFAQQAHPVPRPDGKTRKDEAEMALKPPPASPMDRTPRTVAVPGRPSLGRASKDAGPLAGIRALSFEKDQAQVRLGSNDVRLRAGDSLAGYVVTSIEPGRIVLLREDGSSSRVTREETAGSPGDMAIVTFDASGRGRVVVYSTRIETAEPPEVR
jgi:hypothetical protein